MTTTAAQRGRHPAWGTRSGRTTGVRRQARGSVAITVAIAFSTLIILFIGIELGYLFYQKRELQKAVDLAALAGAQALAPTSCDAARQASKANANGSGENDPKRNLPKGFVLADEDIICGRWDAASAAERHFEANQTEFNAVHVTKTGAPPSLLPFFPGSRHIHADAVASEHTPLASFSVGSKLAAVGDSLLGDLLKTIGLDLVGTSLVGYDGLADATITPGGLLAALGIPVAADIDIGEFNTLLAAQEVSLGVLLDAAVHLAGQDSLLDTNAALLQAIETKLGISDLLVRLGSDATASGLFAEVVAPTASAALNTSVNALDLIHTAIGVATSHRAVDLDLGLLPSNVVNAKVAVIEPPSIGIGGVGATAYTAQVRTFVNIDTGALPLIGNLLRLKLPLIIDVANGQGTITELCTADLRTHDGIDRAEIEVDASVAKICVGKLDEPLFSTSASCEDGLQNEQLLKVSLLGTDLIALDTNFKLNAFRSGGSVVLAEGESATIGNNLLLGTTVEEITNGLLGALLFQSLYEGDPLTPGQSAEMAAELWEKHGGACHSRQCRVDQLTDVKNEMEAVTSGLSGFLGNVLLDTLGIVGDLLTLDLGGLLQGVGSVVGGLLGGLGDLIGGIIGGCTALIGSSDAACKAEIASLLDDPRSGNRPPSGLVTVVGFLLDLLKPVFDTVGSGVITPLLTQVLGVNLGQIDVELKTLDCKGHAGLVF